VSKLICSPNFLFCIEKQDCDINFISPPQITSNQLIYFHETWYKHHIEYHVTSRGSPTFIMSNFLVSVLSTRQPFKCARWQECRTLATVYGWQSWLCLFDTCGKKLMFPAYMLRAISQWSQSTMFFGKRICCHVDRKQSC
jgi:hypothetical protein